VRRERGEAESTRALCHGRQSDHEPWADNPAMPVSGKSSTRSGGTPGPGKGWILCAALLLGYLFLLCDRAFLSAGGSDSSGYLNAAKLLTRGKLTEPVEPLRRFGLSQEFVHVFIPLGFSPGVKPGTMVPSYPPGLPLHMAAAALVGGWARAPFWVSPVAATLSLLLVYGIGRELGMSRALAVAAAACLAVFASFFWFGLQPMSDVPATAWTLAALLAALRARRSHGAAYLCGAAFGMAVLVRPTNILLAVALLLAVPFERRILLRVALGGLPFAAFLFTTNQIANGSPFTSGYGNMSSGFSLGFFPVRIRHYGYWLAALGTPFLVLGWLAVAGVRSLPRRDRVLLIVWPAVLLLFYCCWEPYETWWYTRFLLPGIPAMILAMFFVVERGFRPAVAPGDLPVPPSRRWRILALALSVVVLSNGIAWIRRLPILDSARGEQIYPEACRWTASVVPPNSIIAAMQMTGAMKYYTDLTFARIDWIEPAEFPALRSRIEAAGYHWYALVGPADGDLLQKNLPGAWKEIARLRDQTLFRLDETVPGDRSAPSAGLGSQPPAM
jgi:hypothetical protein